MPACNNLFNVRIVAIGSTGTVNLGNSIQVNPVSNTVDIGGSTPVGDCAISADNEKNLYVDPDIASQLGRVFF